MSDTRDFFESLVYHSLDRRRYTQQSPVMPDVWIQYGIHPGKQQELLMVPDWSVTPADLARDLKERLAAKQPAKRPWRLAGGKARTAAVAYNQNAVVAWVWFDELVRCVLPLSDWWRKSIARVAEGDSTKARLLRQLCGGTAKGTALRKELAEALTEMGAYDTRGGNFTADMLWLTRVVGLLAHLATKEGRALVKADKSEEKTVERLGKTVKKDPELLVSSLVDILRAIEPVDVDAPPTLYTVNLNRKTTGALYDSVAAVKADAARRVFEVKGRGIRWAVVDSGVDARHIAFRKREKGVAKDKPFPPRTGRLRKGVPPYHNNTRIVATYDFVHIRDLLGATPDEVEDLAKKFPVLEREGMQDRLKAILKKREDDARVIDWQELEPFLRVPHGQDDEKYRPPLHPHGTHVAGIIGADWRTTDEIGPPSMAGGESKDLVGVCPEIELYDLRVLDHEGKGNEFAIMSALQFVRNLNAHKDFVAIHGVNLSFSIEHDVANYACGRTPVCDEAERLFASGIVVVAAAGNSGRARYVTPKGYPDEGFRTVSITDPGNADRVITVGATHRSDAHTYGVSYFSSRGPTGDGRQKPDLVAPGEKIQSTVPNNLDDRLDGTSQAAPHVSGAAALLMARYSELIGQPRRIKEILCATATDLGRERYFQGAGLLDILRALQSI